MAYVRSREYKGPQQERQADRAADGPLPDPNAREEPIPPKPDLAHPAADARIAALANRLEAVYGRRTWRAHRPPLDELIVTVLSQHTSDVNTARAYASLRRRFPTWEAVRAAPTADVAEAIRGGGLAHVKAPRLQQILGAIDASGSLSLEPLRALSTEDGRRWLLALPGVGPKTAACVLLFALGRPALPVDTHVHRVARRLGLIAPSLPAARAHEALEPALGGDRDRVYAFHLNLIDHGRRVCTARRPFCERCALTDCCDFFRASAAVDRGAPTADTSPPPSGGR